MPSQIVTVDNLYGPSGRLEALLNLGSPTMSSPEAPYTALVCHPYPPAGGTMHNKVVYNVMKVFSSLGFPVLRFNFRGVGLSEGTFDNGHGEQNDVRAALGWLEHNFKLPILFAGFSFGSHVGLRACCGDVRVKGLIGLGLPVQAAHRKYTYDFMPRLMQPTLFLSGDHDEFAPPDIMETVLTRAPEPKKIVWIEGADHFFQGVPSSPASKLEPMRREIQLWLEQTFALPALSRL